MNGNLQAARTRLENMKLSGASKDAITKQEQRIDALEGKINASKADSDTSSPNAEPKPQKPTSPPKRRPWPGLLARKIRFLITRDEREDGRISLDAMSRLMEQYRSDQQRKLEALIKYYGIPAEGRLAQEVFYELALALANDFVPGFRLDIKEQGQRGAPKLWGTFRLVALVVDIDKHLSHAGEHVTGACEYLAAHEWEPIEAVTLRRCYYGAKKNPEVMRAAERVSRVLERLQDPCALDFMLGPMREGLI